MSEICPGCIRWEERYDALRARHHGLIKSFEVLAQIARTSEAELTKVRAVLAEEPYCDVCGRSGTDLTSPVEVCRDCQASDHYGIELTKQKLAKAEALLLKALRSDELEGRSMLGREIAAALGLP